MSYNGWKNYETWCVSLWLGNEQSSQSYWKEAAEECAADVKEGGGNEYEDNLRRRVTLLLADRMKEAIEESAPELEGFWADLLNAALGEVDWEEVASGYTEELDADSFTPESDEDSSPTVE